MVSTKERGNYKDKRIWEVIEKTHILIQRVFKISFGHWLNHLTDAKN